MSASNINLFHSVQTHYSILFSEGSSISQVLRIGINWSEYLWSLPMTASHTLCHGRIEQKDSSDDIFAKIAYTALWIILGPSLLLSPIRTSFFLIGATLLPKIYNRYSMHNAPPLNLPAIQTAIERIIGEIPINNIRDNGQSLLVTYYLEMKNPEAAQKIIDNKWSDVRLKSLAQLPLLRYYLQNNNPSTAKNILNEITLPLLRAEADLVFVSYYLQKKDAIAANNIISLINDPVYKTEANLLLANYYRKENLKGRAEKTINSINIQSNFHVVKLLVKYCEQNNNPTLKNEVISNYIYEIEKHKYFPNKLIELMTYLIEINELEDVTNLCNKYEKTGESYLKDELDFPMVSYYLRNNDIAHAYEKCSNIKNTGIKSTAVLQIIQHLLAAKDINKATEIIKTLIDPKKVKKEDIPNLLKALYLENEIIKCESKFVKYYLETDQIDIALSILDGSTHRFTYETHLEFVNYYIQKNQIDNLIEFIEGKCERIKNNAYLALVKYHLNTKSFANAEGIIEKMNDSYPEKIEALLLLLTEISKLQVN